ncbi:hypothetical protein BD309DRAFT_982802 [Dichomitus squalens]|uniref:Uncharacterized protein n=1 Tax=Dichomitus squalens TaxID=114155 RepID=A0A4Q9PG45_9APHY|nr:hypothetical protein BD309DRAFT_982802 [Dichomitus squalens]TBU52052.1 hypothetical protein BD310DRAFT_982131 [Dichomitus squalens]
MYTHPRITALDSRRLPTPPEGWKYTNLIDPSGTTPDPTHYPVLLFGPYTYTALSDINNTYSMLIVAWDMQRNLIKQWLKPGARYVWQISYNAGTQTVTFTGQSKRTITATLDELVLGPTVVHLPISSGPVLPYNLSYAGSSTTQFPVIKSGPYSFWPVSFADGRNAFCVVVVDQDKVILKLVNCPGSHSIDRVVINDTAHTIQLVGKNGSAAMFDYNTALACFHCSYVYTKDDFLFLAEYFKVPLSDAEANSMAKAMPQIDCSLCCRMEGTSTADDSDHSHRVKRDTSTFIVGSLLGGVAGGIGGFFIGGPMGAFIGLTAGYTAGAAIGLAVPSSSDKGQYQLSSLEQQYSLVGYARFPCGPFDNTGVRENVFDSPFLRYAELPYSGAITKLGSASSPQAYSPAKKAIGDFPRDPRYKAMRLQDGTEVTKYIFVIVQTDETVNGLPGYQMRINPEDFYPDTWPATQRVNHSQLSEGYRFWALVGHPHMQVYAAGSLYVNITNKKLLGIDTRTGHYFGSFEGQDQAVNDATFGFLKSLGYDTSVMHNYVDIIGYFVENPVVG